MFVQFILAVKSFTCLEVELLSTKYNFQFSAQLLRDRSVWVLTRLNSYIVENFALCMFKQVHYWRILASKYKSITIKFINLNTKNIVYLLSPMKSCEKL